MSRYQTMAIRRRTTPYGEGLPTRMEYRVLSIEELAVHTVVALRDTPRDGFPIRSLRVVWEPVSIEEDVRVAYVNGRRFTADTEFVLLRSKSTSPDGVGFGRVIDGAAYNPPTTTAADIEERKAERLRRAAILARALQN